MSIRVTNAVKSFGSFRALDHVDLQVGSGELVALLGPSGSGKTTLLRIIAGLEQADPESGPILFHDEDVASEPVRRRRVGFVFQHYALFRHMNVFENIAFGPRVRPRRERPSAAEIRRQVHELLELVQLTGLASRYPHQLSGGQRQRVALARALAVQPRVLLLDEPFGALDAKVRVELRRWLRRLHDDLHVTSVFVTHDQDEALEVADRVVVMNRGRIEQEGHPDEVFHRPQTEFVMNFLGSVNRFQGRAIGGRVAFAGAQLPAAADVHGTVRVFVRPHDLELGRRAPSPGAIPGRVTRVHSAGSTVRVDLLADSGEPLHAELSQERYRGLAPVVGERLFAVARQVRVFSTAPEPEEQALPDDPAVSAREGVPGA
jgi:sulfate transport system ATP-binding protein